MSKYYIYCSNNQAYHALINNSIMAKSVMREDFRSDSASYFSKDYLFVTKSVLPYELRYAGIAESYYAVTLEIEDVESLIPAILVIRDDKGSINLTGERRLNDYDSVEGCVGAFVCGEIPISYLSAILFESEEQKASFKKSSTDLWFPEELHKVFSAEATDEGITIELLTCAAEKVDAVLQEEEATKIRKNVVNRNRIKAALYYAIDATTDWNMGAVRGNIDSTMMRFLDKGKCLEGLVEKCFKNILKVDGVSFDAFVNITDMVLEGEQEDINKRFFQLIIKTLLDDTIIRTKLSQETFNAIGQGCIDYSGDERSDVVVAMHTIVKYLTSNMDPDEAMRLIGKYNVLRAFMVFMDQPENADFLKRAATKLSQTERRYAYIMYGILNGMSEVERNQKSNRALELRLEEKVLDMFPNEHLVSGVSKDTIFMVDVQDDVNVAFGIKPVINVWFNCKISQEILLKSKDSKILEKIYLAMVKSCKDDPIPEQDIYAYKEPVIITVQVGETIIENYPIYRKKDAKDFGKKIEKALKTQKEVFNVKGFKKYLAEEKRYQKFYKKNSEMVQEMCGKVK